MPKMLPTRVLLEFIISLLPNIQALSNFNMDILHSTSSHIYTYIVFLPSSGNEVSGMRGLALATFLCFPLLILILQGRVRVKDRQSGWTAVLSNGVFSVNRERVQCRAGIRVPGLLLSPFLGFPLPLPVGCSGAGPAWAG